MITTTTGNIFKIARQKRNSYMVQCCNAMGVMGSGVAKQYADLYPNGVKAYQYHLKQYGGPKYALGTYCATGNMFNIIGQVKPDTSKRAVNYGAMAKALCSIRTSLMNLVHNAPTHSDPKYTVIIPVDMGCDRAGGDWEIMQEIIEQCLYVDNYINIMYVEWDGTVL